MAVFGKTTNGVGTYTLANGERRWRVQYRVGNAVRSKGGFKTKGAAQAWQRHQLVAIDKGEFVDTQKERTAFGDYAERWLERKQVDPAVRDNTFSSYEMNYRVHIKPTFGNTQFRLLDTEAVRTWHAKLKGKRTANTKQAKTLHPSTVSKVYRLMKAMCEEAVEDGYLRANPCRIKRASAEQSYAQAYDEPPSAAQVRALAAAVPPRYRAMVYVAGFGGLRFGELAGLQRKHVDLTAGTVRVEQQVVTVRGVQSVGPPKTDAGRRTVYLPAEATAALREHLDAYTQPADDGYVFTADSGGWLNPPNFRNRVWKPATVAVGCPGVRFHDLRHAAATLAAMTGASTKDLMARMGHASQAAAIRYQHATQAQQEVIALRLDELLAADNVVPLRKVQ